MKGTFIGFRNGKSIYESKYLKERMSKVIKSRIVNIGKMARETVKGFRDIEGSEAEKRLEIQKILINEFERYGFEFVETPIIEYEEFVKSGNIIVRQCGTKYHPGKNVGLGTDYTIFSLIEGNVKFERKGREKQQVSVYPIN